MVRRLLLAAAHASRESFYITYTRQCLLRMLKGLKGPGSSSLSVWHLPWEENKVTSRSEYGPKTWQWTPNRGGDPCIRDESSLKCPQGSFRVRQCRSRSISTNSILVSLLDILSWWFQPRPGWFWKLLWIKLCTKRFVSTYAKVAGVEIAIDA